MCLTLAGAFDAITLPPLHSSARTSALGWVKQCSLVPGKPPFTNSFFDGDMCFRFQILTQIDFGKCNCFISQGPSELNVLLSAIIRVQQECLKYFSVPWLLSPNKFWLLNFTVIRTIFVTSKVYFASVQFLSFGMMTRWLFQLTAVPGKLLLFSHSGCVRSDNKGEILTGSLCLW